MKLKTLATTALTALSIATVPVSASQVRSGYWTIFDTKGDGDNAPLCGMKTDYSNANASIMIKGILGTENLVVHVFKAGWRFPAQGVQLPVTLGFDRGTFGSTTAVGYQRPGLMPVVEFNVARNATKGFLEEFSKANMMWVRFDEGNEQPWTAKMEGSRDASIYFARCIVQLFEANSTQPYATTPPTQPYATTPPTQPYSTQPNKAQPATKKDDGQI